MSPDSPRLHYAPLCETDWPFFLALNLDPDVMRYVADLRPADAIRREAFDSRLAPWYPGSQHWLCLVLREKQSGKPVGVTGFIDRGDGIAETGFLLSPAFQQRGYGYESLMAICELAFSHYGFRKLTASVTCDNLGSKALLEKCGFQQEGTLRQNYFLNGAWQDDWIFGLLNHEFTSPRSLPPPR
ncbi:GNAT family N-acetyltransferase [Entomohabitans teleogrylli]|uniref:GNAT family N-acetyltransferase n=1 Tax=Entomohabitans teleogrylli TaxID=1384589 RepID=UPI000B30F9F2|nr:GNAT family protein [Entomohabitans teleogrylli]